jgi:hypothetical protein
MNLQNTKQRQKQKRQEGKNKCKDKNLDNPSRLTEALHSRQAVQGFCFFAPIGGRISAQGCFPPMY